MSVKQIQINTFPPITNIQREITKTNCVVTEMLNRFPSEKNTNTLEYALEVLDGYCYVPVKLTLWIGRYVRYLNMSDSFDMKLKLGGFVVNDNGYTVTLKTNKNLFEFAYIRVSKRNCIWFMVMIDDDIKRIQMNSLIK